MKLKLPAALLCGLGCLVLCVGVRAQDNSTVSVKPKLFDGMLIAGYVDQGAFLNCAGPHIKFSKKSMSILLGLLPSIRIKEDKTDANQLKNAVFMPTLGFGATAIYHHLVFQVPFFYQNKTISSNGKWLAGVGIGYKF